MNEERGVLSLAEMRRMSGLTQKQVAEKMGVTKPRISQIENGFPYLQFNVVQSYLEALDAQVMVAMADGVQAVLHEGSDYSSAVRNRDRGDRTALRQR
ncbi:helix-turn-helix domain-containing protein [Streptomyces sp. NBC_01451]|uniref:helix-turn-helix domain-containing protein n=1 Tax=Streptomyces sp. NBC_01451 TaxID=2903872 RepID=UPI002E33532C|nr:helix-turn-helix transcriptional regulator [Streptomyces sp. NBC_01451]